jgi:hypothetical protein
VSEREKEDFLSAVFLLFVADEENYIFPTLFLLLFFFFFHSLHNRNGDNSLVLPHSLPLLLNPLHIHTLGGLKPKKEGEEEV